MWFWDCDFEDRKSDSDSDVSNKYIPLHLNRENLKRCIAICEAVNQDRDDDLFCDVNIVVGNKTFAVHKSILKASSDYFDAMFMGNFSEKNESEICIQGISPEVFAILLDHMYGVDIDITFENVKEIYLASDMLCIDALMKDCKRFLKKNWMMASNVQSVFKMAQDLGLKEVIGAIAEYSRERLTTNDVLNYFWDLTDSSLLIILEGRKLLTHVMKEKFVANNVLKWVFFKPDERFPDAAIKVFTGILWQMICRQEFDDILQFVHTFNSVSTEVLNSLVEHLQVMYSKSHQKLIDLQITMVLPERKNTDFKLHLFSFKDWKWETTWFQFSEIPQSFVVSEDDLYMLTCEGCTIINLKNKRTLELPNFPEKRDCSALCVFENNVYVAGGVLKGTWKPMGDILKLSKDRWTPCVLGVKSLCEVSSIKHGLDIYFVCRGNWHEAEQKRKCLSFNTVNWNIKEICNLNLDAKQPKLGIFNDVLYVLSKENYFRGSNIEGIDLKRQELIQESTFESLELRESIIGVTSVSNGLLIVYEMENKIVLVLYKPNEEQCIEFLGLLPELRLQGVTLPLLFWAQR